MSFIEKTGLGFLTALFVASLALPAGGAVPLPGVPECGCDAQAELAAQQERIAEAGSIEDARDLALTDARRARKALGVATWVAPASENLRDAKTRVDDYVEAVDRAATREEVADQFADFVQVAHVSDIVGVDGTYDGGDSRCNFSTGELIAIVLGFILGIIPGLILLVLLC